LLGMDRERRETTSKWAGFGGDAFSPLPLPMIAGEVNSCLFSPKMGMREDLPALVEIALHRDSLGAQAHASFQK
jgi:hypothetical protein